MDSTASQDSVDAFDFHNTPTKAPRSAESVGHSLNNNINHNVSGPSEPKISLPPASHAPPANSARVLSYNFNLLPNCISFSNAHFAEERVAEFAGRVGNKFDILVLQEVFASALVPVAAREYWCNQHQLIHLLSEPQPKSDAKPSALSGEVSAGSFGDEGPASANSSLPTSESNSRDELFEDEEISSMNSTLSGVAPSSATPELGDSKFIPALYPYLVKARQPSFLRMTRETVITDSGLLILSKFPIVDSGSMYFKSTQHWGRQLAPKGCLFAKIRLSENLYMIVVNVHLSSSSTAQETSSDGQVSQTISDQLNEMRHFIETIQSEHPNCPVMVTGDFNINSIAQQVNLKRELGGVLGRTTPPTADTPNVTSPPPEGAPLAPSESAAAGESTGALVETAAYLQLVHTMKGISADMCEVLRDSSQQHLPTRPPTLQFPSFLNKMVATRFPQRHDYCFFSNGGSKRGEGGFSLGHPRLQRFIASSQRPYMYLSDHFGISVTLRNPSINLAEALFHEGGRVRSTPSRLWIYPLLKHARSISRKDFSLGWERYLESALFDSVFKVMGYIFFPLLVYYLLAGFPALRYVFAAIMAGLAANHAFGNKLVSELQEAEFGVVDKDVIEGRAPVSATPKSTGALAAMIASPPKSVWEMWVQSVNDYGWQPCVGYRLNELDGARWLTYLEVDSQARAFGSALRGLRAKPGTVIGVLVDCHHLNPIMDLAFQGYGIVCLPLVPDIKISRNLIDEHECKICIASKKYTPRLLLARSRRLTCVIQLEEIGNNEYDMARGASIDLRGYDQLLAERQSHGPLDRPMCEEKAANAAAASFALAATHQAMGMSAVGSIPKRQASPAAVAADDGGAEFSAGVACYAIGDEEEVTRTVIPITRQQLVNTVLSCMETNLVQDRRAIPNLSPNERRDPGSAKKFGIVAPFSNGFNRCMTFAVLAGGHQLAMCEQVLGGNAAVDMRAMKPDTFVCSRAYLMQISARCDLAESRYCWARQLLFRWAYRNRSRLLRHLGRDSSSLRSMFFSPTFSQKVMRARGVSFSRLIVESPSLSIPYRVREMAMLCITPNVRECVVDAYGQLVAVDGIPPPRTMVTLERLVRSNATTDGETGGEVFVKRLGAGRCGLGGGDGGSTPPTSVSKRSSVITPVGVTPGTDGDEWCDTKLVALWKQDRRLCFLAPKAELLWPLGNVRAVATELEALYKRQCPMIHHIFITCDDQAPLLAVIVPHRDVIEDMLEQRISNWSIFTQMATPLLMDSLSRIAIRNNLPTAHRIEYIHIHPHAFTQHDGFVSASGGLRRKRIKEYFRTSIARLYSGRVANGGCGLTSAAGNEDDLPVTPIDGMTAFQSFAALGQQPSYTARRDGYSGPQASTPFALDIGGTCAKFAFFQPPNVPPLPKFCQLAKVEASFALPKNLKFFRNEDAAKEDGHAGELRFVQCSTQDVPAMVQYIADNKLCDVYKEDGLRYVPATGGGAFRFAPLVESQLGVQLTQLKEMDCIIAGINFLLRHAPELTFTFDLGSSKRVPCRDPTIALPGKMGATHKKDGGGGSSGDGTPTNPPGALFEASVSSMPSSPSAPDAATMSAEERARLKDEFTSNFFPYLLVNIGSGVSMIRCNSETEGDFVRVGGSLIGGGTFWGLVRSMTNLKSWDEINEMTRIDGPGDNTNVDLLVGDIYGYNATSLPGNLPVDVIASTFGKIGADRGDVYFQEGMVGSADSGFTKQDTEGLLLGEEVMPGSSLPANPLASGHHSRSPSYGVDGPNTDAAGMMARSASGFDLGGLGGSTSAASNNTPSPGAALPSGARHSNRAPVGRPQPIDIVRSLVIMMAFNVTQLANLTCQLEGIKTVFFTGGFVRNNPIVHNQVTKALSFWSGGKLQARFLEPDGFVGTLGSLQHVPPPSEASE